MTDDELILDLKEVAANLEQRQDARRTARAAADRIVQLGTNIREAQAQTWDDAIEAARKALIARQGMGAWDADIDILALENPYRAVAVREGQQ